ncbi:MAG: hypothetical protein WCG35_10445 [Betaproteobacteria bacterium]
MKNIILITLMLLSTPVFADGVNAQAAYGDAATLVGMKLILGAVLFYILSFGLINKPKDTAVKNGRWVASTLAMMSFIGYSLQYDNQVRNLVESGIAAVVWFAIGFVIGYVWFKFKKVKADATDIVNVKSKKDIKAFLPVIVLIGFGMAFWLFVYSGFNSSYKSAASLFSKDDNTFDVYECEGDANACKKHLGVSKFNVDKTASQVVVQATNDGKKVTNFVKLDNCIIADMYNWQCGGEVEFGDLPNNVLSEIKSAKYVMINGELTVNDGYINYSRFGKTTLRQIGHAEYNYIKR